MSRRIISTTLSLAIALAAVAMPARPGVAKVVQPDGTTIDVRMFGDYYCHRAETPDGQPLRLDANGFWRVAAPGTDTRLYAPAARQSQPVDQTLTIDRCFPTKGKHKLLMLLVNYDDTHTRYTQDDFYRLTNERGYNNMGSFRDFYLEQSYGALDVEVTVTPWVQLSFDKSYYGPNGQATMIAEALTKIDADIDFRDFDNDNDGVLDGLTVVHQGTGMEASFNPNDIWSHSGELYGLSFDGVAVKRYTIVPEIGLNSATGVLDALTTIGVITHEFGHNLGAPDFYDTKDEYDGTGNWDLMSSGAWNGHNGDGSQPAGVNMWQKCVWGWVEPITLEETADITNMPAASLSPVAYKIDTTVPGEYYLLENRQRVGVFDAALPGRGLLIYHVSENKIRNSLASNTVNSGYPNGMFVVASDAESVPTYERSSYGSINSSFATFPGYFGNNTLSDSSKPSLRSLSGAQTYASVSSITQNYDGTMNFTFTALERPASPFNLRAESVKGEAVLKWDIDEDATPDFFTILANGVEIARTTDREYTIENPTRGETVSFTVTATYADGNVSPAAYTSLRVPENPISRVYAEPQTEDGELTLRFEIDNSLSRLDGNYTSSYSTIAYTAQEIAYAQRFRANDLYTYKGAKITSVGFFALGAPDIVSYSVCVWEVNSAGDVKLVSEKIVEEHGLFAWRDVILDKQVTIIQGRDYLIGVKIRPSDFNAEFITDLSGLSPEVGAMVCIANQWQPCHHALGTAYIRATVSTPLHTSMTSVPDLGNPDSSGLDLIYPIGYKVYRDGVAVGETGNLVFFDHNVTPGEHLYSLAALYMGGSESEDFTVEITAESSSLTEIQIEAQTIEYFNLQGILVTNPTPGAILIRRQGDRVDKVIIP